MTSTLNNNSDSFPAFVAMHNMPDIHSEIVRSERELGEWYAAYDVQSAWFEDGTLFERNHRGQVSELCKADTEEEAYLEMARRAHKDDRVWFINIESLMDGEDDGENVAAMVQALRCVRSEVRCDNLTIDDMLQHISYLDLCVYVAGKRITISEIDWTEPAFPRRESTDGTIYKLVGDTQFRYALVHEGPTYWANDLEKFTVCDPAQPEAVGPFWI